MDPASAAGLGLGVVSLALQLFVGCIRGYEMFVDAVDMPKKFEHLRVRMRLEQMRFLNWGEKVGLLHESLEEPSKTLQLHRNSIFDLLMEIQQLFKSCLKMELKFGSTVEPNSNVFEDPAIEASPKVGSKRVDAFIAKASSAMGRSMQIPKRLQWAVVKQDQFEKLIQQLISYNDSMVSLLDRLTIQQIHEMQMQSHLVMLQLSSKIDDLRQLTQAMQVKTPAGNRGMSQSQSGSGTTLYQDIAAQVQSDADILAHLARFKADRLVLEAGSSEVNVELLAREDVTVLESGGTRDCGTYDNEAVWIEWKEYDQNSQVPGWVETIQTRVTKLAALLGIKDKPKEFRTPECIGCFHDVDEEGPRYGLVYRMPDSQSPDTVPQSLLDCLRQNKPSLTERVALAAALVSSLMFLHSVNWLHKGIRGENIIIFHHDGPLINYNDPFISGFEYARPDLPNELTEKPQENFEHDIYRHPHAITNPDARSQKTWDIYSLGVVLTEIAFWKSIDKILKIDLSSGKSARSKIREVQELILGDELLDSVRAEVGNTYAEVVRRCVNGGADLRTMADADEAEPDVGAEMLRVFSEGIFAAVKSVSV